MCNAWRVSQSHNKTKQHTHTHTILTNNAWEDTGLIWVFCALFDTMSTVKLFDSFEYGQIPLYDSSWRCPLYRSTIFKSSLQLLSASIFQLPNKSPSFRLRHSANEKLLNVYVPHLSINSDSRNLYYKYFKRSRTIAQQKSNSIQERKTPGLHRELKYDLLTEKFDFFLIRMDTNEN